MPDLHPFTVALVGRPNVGKSSLFNRLVGKRIAIVDDTPGVTRDWKEGQARLQDMHLTVLDTPGLEDLFGGSLETRLKQQAAQAMARADVILLLFDARTGLTPMDEHFAAWLRTLNKPVHVVANKAETDQAEALQYEAFRLGFGTPVSLSALQGYGLEDLAEVIRPYYRPIEATQARPDTISLAIVGRPNAGKSTLLNAIIGEQRVLTGPEAGLTRDAISVDWMHGEQAFKLVDTAGMRRRSRIEEALEKASTSETRHALQFANVVVLMVDANLGIDKQDLTIAQLIQREGRGLVVALNKWDLVADKKAFLDDATYRFGTALAEMRDTPLVPISALKARQFDPLFTAVQQVYKAWNSRVPTSPLNDWLKEMSERHPAPLVAERRLKIKYMTQIKSRPPTFAAFSTSNIDALPEDYKRYLINGLRQTFSLPGTPIRLVVKKGKNPYVG